MVKTKKIHDGIYGTFGCCQSNYIDFQRMIRKDGYKLMLFPKIKRVELYNLNDDPFETTNLAEQKDYKPKVKALFEDLIIMQKMMKDTLNLKTIFNNKI
jgi:arylsulfatase A-like enzyme